MKLFKFKWPWRRKKHPLFVGAIDQLIPLQIEANKRKLADTYFQPNPLFILYHPTDTTPKEDDNA